MAAIGKAMRKLACCLIRGYQYLVSPFLPPRCRFAPTCSEYAVQAIQRHGLWRGTRLATRRICRCHPWHPGGYDPVPPAEQGDRAHPTQANRPHG